MIVLLFPTRKCPLAFMSIHNSPSEKEKTAHIFWTRISNFGHSELHCYGLFVFITCNLENRTMQKFYIYSISDSALFAKEHYNNCFGLLWEKENLFQQWQFWTIFETDNFFKLFQLGQVPIRSNTMRQLKSQSKQIFGM